MKFRLTPVAAALATLFAVPSMVLAQEQPAATELAAPAKDGGAVQLPAVKVEGQQESYKADRVSSPKFTQPLVDTPQTIAVIKKELIAEQGATSLSDVLRNTPGITFQLGENGNTQSGDSIFLRGFDTQNSIFIDNIRDLGAAVRDVFNVEQVEVVKGPAGADNGRGATSGYINLVSKLPQADDFINGSVSYGTEDRQRITADLNEQIQSLPGASLRLNLLGEQGGVAGRDFIQRESWGVAPSVAFGLGTPTRFYAYSQHIQQNNTPYGGVSAIGVGDYRHPDLDQNNIDADPVDTGNYYGLDDDFEDIKANMFTARIEHDFAKGVTLRNLSRYGKSEQERILTSPLRAPTVADDPDGTGPQPAVLRPDPTTWTQNRTRHASFRENEILTNQTNVTAAFDTGAIKHAVAGGVEFIHERQFSPTFASASLGTAAPANLYNPNPHDPFTTAPNPTTNGAFSDGSTVTAAAYLFDTLKFGERWQFSGGLRLERYDTDFESVTASTATPPVLTPSRLEVADNLLSWKVGALFKPMPNGSVYVAYANSLKPPGSDNFTLSAAPPNATTGAVNINASTLEPQKAKNIELGTKWDLLGGKLAATAALFHSENENDLARTDPADSDSVIQYGKRRVKGIELGLVGQITQAWQVSAGVTKQDTKVKEGVISNATGSSTQSGAAINFSPELSANLWSTYKFPIGLTLGGGLRYVDSQVRTINVDLSTVTAGVVEVPDYTVVDAMAAYDLTRNVGLQLNVYNLFDEEYIASINNSGHRYNPGTPQSCLLTLNLRF